MRRNIFLSLAVMTLLLTAFCLSVSAKGTSLTGKELPDFLKEAIKMLPKKDPATKIEIPEADRLTSDQIVYIPDMPKWCAEMKIFKGCENFGQAFVMQQQYPIYVNGDGVNTKSQYAFCEKAWSDNVSPQIVYLWAALIYHEQTHARGDSSEVSAYSREVDLLKYYESKGYFALAPWAKQHIKDTERELQIAATTKPKNLTVLASGTSPLPQTDSTPSSLQNPPQVAKKEDPPKPKE